MSNTLNGDGAPAGAPEVEDSFDLRAFTRTMFRRRWLILPFFLATILAASIITLYQRKIYEAVCTVIIDVAAPRVLDKEQVQDVVESGTGGYWYSREYYETQYKVLTSNSVAQRVIDRLQLGSNLEFLGLADVKDPAEIEKRRRKPRHDPLEVLRRNLRIDPVKDSRVVRIRYEAPDRELAALIANTFAEAYVAESLSVKSATTQNASDWLEQQLADLERKLEESGRALFEFKRTHDIVATSWEDRQSMVSQRLTAINDALTRTRVRKAEIQAANDAIEALGAAVESSGPASAEALPQVLHNPAVQQLKLRFIDADGECALVRARYLENHPQVIACEKRLGVAREALRNEVLTSIAAARRQFQEVAKTEANLVALLGEAKSNAFGLNQYEREYLELKRTYDNNQRLYELILRRLKDTGVTGLLQISNIRILDRARPPVDPVRPDIPKNIGLALVIAVLGGIGLAFLAEYLDTSIVSQEQVEERLGLPFLGIIPSVQPNPDDTPQDLIVHTHPQSTAAECVRAVRTNLLFMSPEKPLRTMLITSSGPQEGKTTTATSLAITMTTSGNRVLLVDADMRRPRVHRIFRVPNEAGLSSLILGEGALAEVVTPTQVPNLFVLPCGPVPPNPAELLHTKAFARLLDEMRGQYDRIIIDSPPVGVVADAVVISANVDGTLVVLKAGRTSRDLARHSVRQLRDVNANLLGAVLNDLDLESQNYGKYSYYYRYGYYYSDKPRPSRPSAA